MTFHLYQIRMNDASWSCPKESYILTDGTGLEKKLAALKVPDGSTYVIIPCGPIEL